MENFSFALITDKNYLHNTLAVILNLLKTKSLSAFYKIYLIYTESERTDIISYFDKFNIKNYKIEIIYFDNTLIKDFNGIRHVSNATYVKYFIPELIKDEKVLFLDSDIYINRSIEEIWNEFQNQYSIVAVSDPGYHDEDDLIGIKKTEDTFNAGVLFLNCKKMREIKMCDKLIEYTNLNSKKIKNADQTVFNVICKDDWKKVSCSYNLQRIYFTNSAKFLRMKKYDLRKVRKNPHIIHFTTHSKPWMFRCAHPYKKMYLKNYKELFNFKYNDITIINLLKYIYEYCQYLKAKIDNIVVKGEI